LQTLAQTLRSRFGQQLLDLILDLILKQQQILVSQLPMQGKLNFGQ